MDGLSLFLSQAIQITLIDLVLSGDNVGVIALAIRDLPKKSANQAKIYGITGAVLLRVFFVTIISSLFTVGWLHLNLFGGILLLYITWNMMGDSDEGKKVHVSSGKSLSKAVLSIILADASMSLDNVLAIASVAMRESGGSHIGGKEFSLILFGLILCIPIIFFGSGIVARLMQKFPIIIYICAGILVDTAFRMIFKDEWVAPFVRGAGNYISIGLGIAVVVYGAVILYFRKRKRK